MLKKLQSAKTFLLTEFGRKRPSFIQTTPTIPLELIYQIIDEYWPLLAQENGRFGLRSLSQTCRSLSAYCRPLLFHNITLHGLDFLFPFHPTMTTRPERFSKLLLAYPELASFIKELHIVLVKPQRAQRLLQSSTRAERKSQRAEMKSWQIALSIPSATLSALHITISWGTIPPELVTTFLHALKITPSLRSLELDGDEMPLGRILQSCPFTLKHFGLLGGYNIHDPYEWVTPPQPTCHLESLTLSVGMSKRWISSIFLSESHPFNLEGLRHIRTAPFNFSSPFSKIHTLPSQTLQCVHIHLSRNPGGNVLSVSDLKALTHIEVVADRLDNTRTARLLALLNWLEKSLGTLGGITPQVLACLSSLTICILLQTNLPDAYNDYFDTWNELTTNPNRLGWKRVESANTLCFFSRVRLDTTYALYSTRNGPPRLISSFGGQVRSCSYRSLWDSCLCSGWKDW
ncbi:hypothetical protein BKA70DRAFT_1528185 [Coprinopsis sp. MPI-PUGE-AT-0042]|nr:hypothetical protein BKA70DRAFT_1528185 [Coprinopsis sp. MPI-PUGE-AT-0042]